MGPPSDSQPPEAPLLTLRSVFETEAAFVFRILRRLGVPERDLDDAAQDVFMVVHRRLSEFEQGASIRSWLFGIARRVAAGRARRGYERNEVSMADVDVGAVPQNAEQRLDVGRLLGRALRELDSAKRDVFVLYELEGLSMHEVASAVGCPLQTAYSRLHAARSLVREYLAPPRRRKSS